MGPNQNATIVAFLLAIVSAGCAREPAQTEPGSGAQESGLNHVSRISCEDGYAIDTRFGRLTNNVWNKQAIGAAPYEQCLLVRGAAHDEQYGWSWSWPADSQVVLAFPQLVFGWKPWNGGQSSTDDLPAAVRDLQALSLAFDAETEAQGQHIFSIALWLTRSGETSAEPMPADISADINIWLDGSAFDPTGDHIADVQIGDAQYELWHAANMGDASGSNANRWTHLVYRSKLPQHRGPVDIKAFLDDAVTRGLISRDAYVSSVEIGNEVMSGTGETWIKNLALAVR